MVRAAEMMAPREQSPPTGPAVVDVEAEASDVVELGAAVVVVLFDDDSSLLHAAAPSARTATAARARRGRRDKARTS